MFEKIRALNQMRKGIKQMEEAEMNSTKYNGFLTLWKGFWAFLGALGVSNTAAILAVGLPETWEAAVQANWWTIALSLIPALWRVLDNTRKNWRDDGIPLWRWPWEELKPKATIVLLICVTLFMGTFPACQTTDWKQVQEFVKASQPYIREGIAIAASFYAAKKAQEAQMDREERILSQKRAALVGCGATYALAYRAEIRKGKTPEDAFTVALNKADETVKALGYKEGAIALVMSFRNPEDQVISSDLDLLIDALQDRGILSISS